MHAIGLYDVVLGVVMPCMGDAGVRCRHNKCATDINLSFCRPHSLVVGICSVVKTSESDMSDEEEDHDQARACRGRDLSIERSRKRMT